MSISTKARSKQDAAQIIQASYNDTDNSLTTNGFLAGKAGRKMDFAISTTNIANDTVTIDFSEDGTLLYTYVLIYTDGSRTDLLSAERTA